MEHHSRVCETSKMCCCISQMASSAQLFILAVFSTFFWPGSFVHRAEEKQVCEAADVRWSVRSSLISILFLPFGFKLLNSLEILGIALLSWPFLCFAYSLSVKWDENLIWKLKLIDLNKLKAFCWLYGKKPGITLALLLNHTTEQNGFPGAFSGCCCLLTVICGAVLSREPCDQKAVVLSADVQRWGGNTNLEQFHSARKDGPG